MGVEGRPASGSPLFAAFHFLLSFEQECPLSVHKSGLFEGFFIGAQYSLTAPFLFPAVNPNRHAPTAESATRCARRTHRTASARSPDGSEGPPRTGSGLQRRCLSSVASQAQPAIARIRAHLRKLLFSDGMVTGLFSERSGASRCPGSGRLPVSRVSATHPNPAWRVSLWPRIPPTLHQTVLRAAPEPARSLTVVPLIQIRGITGRLRRGYGV